MTSHDQIDSEMRTTRAHGASADGHANRRVGARGAFTLIELLVVVSIIALLISI